MRQRAMELERTIEGMRTGKPVKVRPPHYPALLCSRRLDCLRCLRCLRAQRALPASLSPSALSALVHAMLPSHRPSQLLLALLLIALPSALSPVAVGAAGGHGEGGAGPAPAR
jgi:hypothetical protein